MKRNVTTLNQDLTVESLRDDYSADASHSFGMTIGGAEAGRKPKSTAVAFVGRPLFMVLKTYFPEVLLKTYRLR